MSIDKMIEAELKKADSTYDVIHSLNKCRMGVENENEKEKEE